MGQRPGATIAVAILLAGWAASAIIRTYQGVHVEIVAEMTGAGLASAALYAKMSGRNGSGNDDGAA